MIDFFTARSPIEIAGWGIGVIGGLITIYTFAKKILQKSKQEKQAAEERFNAEVEKLEVAGGSAPGRMDLGFFVLMELSSLRESLSLMMHYRLMCLIFAIIFLSMCIAFHGDITLVAGLLTISTLIMSFFISSLVEKERRYIHNYQKRVQDIWRAPVDKRVKSKDSSASPPVKSAN